MSAENWKENVSVFADIEQATSFLSRFGQKFAAFFNGAEITSNDLLGLDIGADRIKVLKFNLSSSPVQIIAYDMAPLPAGVIVKDEIKSPAVIGTALRDLLRKSGIAAKFAAVAIPRTLAIIKNITVDKRLTADDIESRAWIEANRLFPDLVGNIYLDFTITGPSLQAPDQMDLLLVACRKEHVKPYLDIIYQAGLIPKIIDVNCYALERAMQAMSPPDAKAETIALLNVNMTQSSMIVMNRGQMIHAHDQTYDGARLMKQVDEFIKVKRAQPGMENTPMVAADAAYHALLQENFLSHLRHTIHFFYSSRSNITIDKIMLAGDCSSIPDFPAFIANEIGIKTTLANPFTNMSIDARLDAGKIMQIAPTLMLCSGLALSGVRITT